MGEGIKGWMRFGVAVAIATLLFRAMFGTIFLFLILMVLVWASWWVGDRK